MQRGRPVQRTVDEYIEWCLKWLDQLSRILTPSGAAWINLGYLPVPGRGTEYRSPTCSGLTSWDFISCRRSSGTRPMASPAGDASRRETRSCSGSSATQPRACSTSIRFATGTSPTLNSVGADGLRCNPLGMNPVTFGRFLGLSRVAGQPNAPTTPPKCRCGLPRFRSSRAHTQKTWQSTHSLGAARVGQATPRRQRIAPTA